MGHTIADRAAGEPSDDVFMQVAQMLSGFSGREISKLCMALQTHIFAEAGMSKAHHLEITTEMLFEVVNAKVKEHNKALRMISEGYAFKMRSGASEGGSLPPTPSGKNLLPARRRCAPVLMHSALLSAPADVFGRESDRLPGLLP